MERASKFATSAVVSQHHPAPTSQANLHIVFVLDVMGILSEQDPTAYLHAKS